MKQPDNLSFSRSIRLREAHWAKLRELMAHHENRKWLEKAIDREHAKLTKEPK